MFQYSFAEVVDKSIEKLLDKESYDEYREVIQAESSNSIKRNLVSDKKVFCWRKDGKFFSGEMGISKITIDGEPLFTSCIRDITQREMYETNLIKAKEEALRANQAKSEFLASMSHELRTPLNAIIGFSQLIMKCTTDPLSESQSESVEQIRGAGEHLLSLINDILDLAKIDSGKTALSLEPLYVKNLVAEVGSLIESTGSKLGIQVSIHNNCHEDTYIWGDGVRVKQVLLNLLSNGIKYNKPNGEVFLKTDQDPSSEDRILFSVSDTGRGISPEHLKNIFEPFNRGDAEGTEIEGTGIGLSITKKLIEAMNGSLNVTSSVGKGSCFEVSLPVCVDQEDVFEEQETSEKPIQKEEECLDSIEEAYTLLYVEDNVTNLRLFQKFLSTFPQLNLKSAGTAEIGIEMAESNPPDIILMDINLPGMDGYEAVRVIKQNETLCNIPVIGLSANAMQGHRDKALKGGFDAYITKPIDFEVLSKLLLETLTKNQSIDEDNDN